MNRDKIRQDLEEARDTFHQLVRDASAEDLRRPSQGTRWTNRQLLFHMVFGYLIVRTLLPLVHTLGRHGWSRRFAIALNAARRPFHLINYLGSVGGGMLISPAGMVRLLDRSIRVLHRRLEAETDTSLALSMQFPPTWDPYFQPTMTVRDLYRYGTLHFDHHRRQLNY